MSKENGFLPHRRGIWRHVRDGRMTLQDVAVHQYIASQADTRTGVWLGSAGALAGELCISPRIGRRFLERLSRGGYIKRFPIPGKHVCYPILVHKFLITDGEHKGEHLNALASMSFADLQYFSGEHMDEHKGERLSPQKILETGQPRREKKKEAPAAPSPIFSGQHFSVTKKQDALLGEAFPWVDRAIEYRKADSWLEANPERHPKKANRFLHNWFSRITQLKGKNDARPTASDLAMQNARALGLTDKPVN